jgi:hypothetical protein
MVTGLPRPEFFAFEERENINKIASSELFIKI